MRKLAFFAVAATFALSACGGGGGSSPSTPAGGGGGGTTQTEATLSAANGVGSQLKTLSAYERDISSSVTAGTSSTARATEALGVCKNYMEFFAPDKNGDPNSTQTQYFYDTACTQIARDIVRIYTSTGRSSETVARTVKQYALGNATPIAARSDAVAISNATFDKYGFPIAADGFDRLNSAVLNIAGSKTIVSDDELVMEAASSSGATTLSYCADSAGFNATGLAKLNETFGWQGGILTGGIRTVNSDGSVTWTATHAGTGFKGAIGSLSLVQGVQNTKCPISTPMFTLSGGTATETYNIPVGVTYLSGVISSLTITNATLSNGDTLNVTTNSSAAPSSSTFILGVVSNGSTQIATFAVDAFGDGTLTVAASGAQFVITDWQVVR
ncbi:MAG: hypothetical protein ACLPYS_16275 [Vulcanimicrobiaceae bacterium]